MPGQSANALDSVRSRTCLVQQNVQGNENRITTTMKLGRKPGHREGSCFFGTRARCVDTMVGE